MDYKYNKLLLKLWNLFITFICMISLAWGIPGTVRAIPTQWKNIQNQLPTDTVPNTRESLDFFHPFTRCKWKHPNSEWGEEGGERRKRKEELRNRKVTQWFEKIAMNINWCFLPVSGSQVLQVSETSVSFHWKLNIFMQAMQAHELSTELF